MKKFVVALSLVAACGIAYAGTDVTVDVGHNVPTSGNQGRIELDTQVGSILGLPVIGHAGVEHQFTGTTSYNLADVGAGVQVLTFGKFTAEVGAKTGLITRLPTGVKYSYLDQGFVNASYALTKNLGLNVEVRDLVGNPETNQVHGYGALAGVKVTF